MTGPLGAYPVAKRAPAHPEILSHPGEGVTRIRQVQGDSIRLELRRVELHHHKGHLFLSPRQGLIEVSTTQGEVPKTVLTWHFAVRSHRTGRFVAGCCDQIEAGEGKLYLASVHDALSHRGLGNAMGPRYKMPCRHVVADPVSTFLSVPSSHNRPDFTRAQSCNTCMKLRHSGIASRGAHSALVVNGPA